MLDNLRFRPEVLQKTSNFPALPEPLACSILGCDNWSLSRVRNARKYFVEDERMSDAETELESSPPRPLPPQRNPIPTPQEFFLLIPLYRAFALAPGNATDVAAIVEFRGTCDAYCHQCALDSIFTNTTTYHGPYRAVSLQHDHDFSVHLSCRRISSHRIEFHFRVGSFTITKTGQYPSVADFHTIGVRKYRALLGDERYAELTRGIGLAAHGVGIGSFVYLRRIFETLIEEAHRAAAGEPGWDEAAYTRKRMDEKVALLANHLPAFLVDNKGLYAVLSKGIHELREQECLQYFETVRLAIELILDEQLERQSRRRKIEQATRALSDIKRRL